MRPATTVAALSEARVRPSVRLRHRHPAQKRRASELWLPENTNRLECGPMPNLMVALPNIGGALCSTPQSLADARKHQQINAVLEVEQTS